MFVYVFISFCLLARIADCTNVENSTTSGCGEVGDCITNMKCDNKCGCDSSAAVLFYNETLDECVVNVKKLLQSLNEKYYTQDKIRLDVEKIFQGVIFSAILFGSCAALCVFTACIYCFRINYMDTRLKNDIEALASKLKRECRFKTMTKKSTQPASESCNIIVEEAGVFVV